MLENVIDSTEVEPRDRFEWWLEATQRLLQNPALHTSDDAHDFQAKHRFWQLGPVHFSVLSYPSVQVRRTERHVRRGDPEFHSLSLTLNGEHGIDHIGRNARIGAGDMLFYSTSYPYVVQTFTERGPVEQVMVSWPRDELPLPTAKNDNLLAVRLPGDQGIGSLLSGFLTGLARTSTTYSRQDAARLGPIALNLITALIAHHADRTVAISPDDRKRLLVHSVCEYIDRHLGDPALKPATIAAAHHLSTRQLHRLFEQHEFTVASLIRERRLERCRQDLADPLLAHRPIRAVAATWGLPHPEEFSRMFRTAYGTTPRDFREQALEKP